MADHDHATAGVPRAVVHKNILDAAEREPEASISAIAEQVGGATPNLVENVLEEYGDPAAESEQADATGHASPAGAATDAATAADGGSTSGAGGAAAITPPGGNGTDDRSDDSAAVTAEDSPDGSDGDSNEAVAGTTEDSPEGRDDEDADDADPGGDQRVDDPEPEPAHGDDTETGRLPDPSDLSAAQRETLRAVREHPRATQAEIAEELDVVRATVCNRLNDIDGFDWQDREAFATSVLGADQQDLESPDGETDSSHSPSGDGADSPHSPQSERADDDTPDRPPAEADATDGKEVDATDGKGTPARVDDLADRLAAVESTLASIESRLADGPARAATDGAGDSPAGDPELLCKAMRALLDDDALSNDETVALTRELL